MTTKRTVLLLIFAAAVALAPLALTGDLAGTDDQATAAIGQLRPGYQPWAAAFWQPSEAAEPYLFALQAALGSGFIAYFIYRHSRKAR